MIQNIKKGKTSFQFAFFSRHKFEILQGFFSEFSNCYGTYLKQLGPQRSDKDETYLKKIRLNLSNFEFQ